MVKQVIVVRKDLNMGRGKCCAQVAHASMKVIVDMLRYTGEIFPQDNFAPPFKHYYCYALTIDDTVQEWVRGIFTKIVVSCGSEEELLALNKAAEKAGLLHALIQDVGKTEFHGVPTYTCLAIGPAEAEEIDKITGGLKLL